MVRTIGRYYMSTNNLLKASWNAPHNVKTIITTRLGGVSNTPYDSLNLGTHVGDDIKHVIENRNTIIKNLPANPYWLNQTHSNNIICVDGLENDNSCLDYDASFTTQKNKVCVVMSADCIPILLTDTQARFAAAIHAGWRGVENNIIRNSIISSNIKVNEIIAYIGPSICQKHFEVGAEVLEQFTKQYMENKQFFIPNSNNKFNCDLAAIAKLQMLKIGILPNNIHLSNLCTYCEKELFYSYRRDGITGRIASLIWLE